MRIYEALADALVAEGARHLFCVMGDGNLDLLMALQQRGVILVHARHEQHAVSMADGYARAGGFGLCSVTHGPGLAQAGAALVAARKRCSPLLLLAADTPAGQLSHVQDFPQAPYIHATAGVGVEMSAPGVARARLREAMVAMRGNPGPVVLNMPTDVQLAPLPADHTDDWAVLGPIFSRMRPAPSAVAQASAAIARIQHPVLLVGRGATEAAAEHAVAALASHLGAPIVTTLLSRGAFADHPLHVGMSGGLGNPDAERVCNDADGVIVLGSSLSTWSTRAGRLLNNRTIVLAGGAASTWSGHPEPDVRLPGDAEFISRDLLAALPGRRPTWANTTLPSQPTESYLDENGIDPRRAARAINDALPSDRLIVVDGGHFLGWICDHVNVLRAADFVFAADFGAIGPGLPVAIGVATSTGRRATLIAGDGGFLMNVGELETAVRHHVPLTVIVMNDRAYGQELHSLRAKNLPTWPALFDAPDLAPLASGFGATTYTVRTPTDLSKFASFIANPIGVQLVDIRINREVVHRATQEIFETMRSET